MHIDIGALGGPNCEASTKSVAAPRHVPEAKRWTPVKSRFRWVAKVKDLDHALFDSVVNLSVSLKEAKGIVFKSPLLQGEVADPDGNHRGSKPLKRTSKPVEARRMTFRGQRMMDPHC